MTTIPTIGFNVETVNYKNIRFQVWDLGGQSSIRPYWRCYYPNTNAIIYVVDSADQERFLECKQELAKLVAEDKMAGIPVLIFANKQDLLSSKPPEEVRLDFLLSNILRPVGPLDRWWSDNPPCFV